MRRLALFAAAGIALAGCGGAHQPPSAAQKHYPFVVHSPHVARASRLRLHNFVQFLSPTRLGIVTTGSSSCPSVPDELVFESPYSIRIHLAIGRWDGDKLIARPPPSGICTADIGTTQMVLTIDPKLIDVHSPLTVRFFSKDSKQPLVRIAAPLTG